MSALSDVLLPKSTLTVEALSLSITQTHDTGNSGRVYLIEDCELGMIEKSMAAPDLAGAIGGRVVIALDADEGESSNVYFQRASQQDTVEVLRSAIETLAVALTAAERASGGTHLTSTPGGNFTPGEVLTL